MITSFSTISLDQTLLNVTGNGVLQVGGNQVVYTNQTGIFITTGQTGSFGGGSTPTGNLTGAFYPLNSNPSNYITSSQTGIFYTNNNLSGFITGFNSGLYVLNSNTGNFTSVSITGGAIQPYINLSGISGILVSTGISGLILFNGLNLVQTSQSGAFASVINLNSTGSYLYGLINASSAGVSSLNLASGALTLNGAGNVSVTTNGQSITISGNTGAYSSFTLNSQTGNFITSSQTGNFTSVSITGGIFQSFVNLSGQNGLVVSTGVSGLVLFNGVNFVQTSQTGTFITSSQTGTFASVINLGITGNTLQLEINSLNGWTGGSTGLYYPLNLNPSNYITASQTGVFITTGMTGAFGGGTTPTGNLTGAFYPLNSNPAGYITSLGQTGAYLFNTNITSGVTNQFIIFPTNLGNNPTVVAHLNNISGNYNIEVQSSGITSSGYWAQFSNIILDNNYILTTFASLSTSTGLATTVFVYNNTYNVTGLTGIGTSSYIPMYTGNGSILTNSTVSFVNGSFQSINISGNINNYSELNLQNFSNGISGSADLIATNDIGNENIWYVDLGINGSQYNSQYVGNSGDGYVYSSGNDFYIGNVSANRNLYFFVGNTAYSGSMAAATINKSGTFINTGNLYVSGSPVITQAQIGTGLQIISTGNNIGISTYFNNQFLTGLQLRTLIPTLNTYTNILSGNIGPGTWLINCNSLIQTPPHFVNVTIKLWSGIGAFFAEEISIPTGSATISGYGTVSLNGIITNPAVSMPLVLSCAGTTGNLAALPAPIDNLTAGIPSGVSTYINAIRLY